MMISFSKNIQNSFILALFCFTACVLKANPMPYNLITGLPNVYITPESERIGHTWLKGNVWEKHLIEKFYSLLPHNDYFVVLDLGAQTGCFSLLAKYFPNSRWYAFEPIHEAATELQRNLALNNISNVSIHQVAVTNYSGVVTLNMPAMNEWGLSTIGENVQRFLTVMKREIECIDLDSFIQKHTIKKVDFMKLDTEGSELYILQGAKKTIEKDRPIILMEYNEVNMKQCNVLKKEVDEFLIEIGYEWKMVSTEDILCTPILPNKVIASEM